MDTSIKKNRQAIREGGLEINVEKTKYMLPSRHQNAGQNHNLKAAHRSFENVTVEILGNDCNKSKFHSGGK
jgi:hypothetical protein